MVGSRRFFPIRRSDFSPNQMASFNINTVSIIFCLVNKTSDYSDYTVSCYLLLICNTQSPIGV